jgi:1-phosphofructokinase family hexose kinase
MPIYDLVIAAPNSAVDSYYVLERLEVGAVNKAKRAFHTAGGKGINSARALRRLGGRPLCLGIVAGNAGRFIVDQMESEGIAHDLIWGQGESRHCNTVQIAEIQDTTGILEPGPRVSQETVGALAQRILAHHADAPFVVLAGSLLPGFPSSFYGDVTRQLKELGARVCIDCSGPALRDAAECGPAMVKVNRSEFQSVFLGEHSPFSWSEAGRVYGELCARGVEILVITDGRNGSYVFSPDRELIHVHTPVETIVSSAGSGDAYLSAILLALGRGQALERAAAFASAAAAANLSELGCGFFDPARVDELLPITTVEAQPWRRVDEF